MAEPASRRFVWSEPGGRREQARAIRATVSNVTLTCPGFLSEPAPTPIPVGLLNWDVSVAGLAGATIGPVPGKQGPKLGYG